MIKVIQGCTSPINSLSSQLLDLQNPDADYLLLILIMLCESISGNVFMIQGHLQDIKLWSL